jgi:hypothetical protein
VLPAGVMVSREGEEVNRRCVCVGGGGGVTPPILQVRVGWAGKGGHARCVQLVMARLVKGGEMGGSLHGRQVPIHNG